MSTYEDLLKSGYQESAAAKKYRADRDAAVGSKPAAYVSPNAGALENLYNRLAERKAFTYSPQSDTLYSGYKTQYQRLGRQAMQDTMGQAAALTGGYGSTYARSAGQQAYNSYLQKLNDRLPELYSLAKGSYDSEGDELRRLYELLQSRENSDYSRYRDSLSDYNAELDRLNSLYNTERTFDYGQYRDAVTDAKAKEDSEYKKSRDAIADAQWQAELDESIRQFNAKNSGSSKSGGSSGGKKEKTYDGMTASELSARVQMLLSKMPLSQVAALLKNGKAGLTASQTKAALEMIQF